MRRVSSHSLPFLCLAVLPFTLLGPVKRVMAQQTATATQVPEVGPAAQPIDGRPVVGRSRLPAPSPETWKQASHTQFPHGAEIETIAEPHHRQKCNVASFDSDRIVCKRAFGQTKAYPRESVEAVYVRASHAGQWAEVLLPGALVGGNVYLMVLLAAMGPAGIAAMIPVGCFAVLWTNMALWSATDEAYEARELYRRSPVTLAEVHP